MYQEIIVGLIGVAVVVIVAYKLYQFFTSANEQKENYKCSNCACGAKHSK